MSEHGPEVPEDTDDDGALSTLSRNLRTERRRQALSVQDLSDRSGVSFGSISTIERGRGNPSLSSIARLAVALGLPVETLLAPSSGDPQVVRAGERIPLPDNARRSYGQEPQRELLTPRTSGTLRLIRTTLPPGFTNEGNAFRSLGTEAIVVESGRLEVVHGDERVVLNAGDSMTYRCSTAHWWRNDSDGPTVVLGAVTPFEP